jgi:hypothetical protein
MEYVFMQKAKPEHAIGVPVSIDVIDANHNFRNIGTATSDDSGTFALTWTPDISGSYTVIATFAGSESYWKSSAETHFYASDAATPTPTVVPLTNAATTTDLLMYLSIGVIAIIIAIAIVGLLILRKHP